MRTNPLSWKLLRPWCWSRWWLAMAIPCLLAGYVLMPPVTAQIWVRTGCDSTFERCMFQIQRPIFLLLGDFPALSDLYHWESECIDRALGPPPIRLEWEDGNLVFYSRSMRWGTATMECLAE